MSEPDEDGIEHYDLDDGFPDEFAGSLPVERFHRFLVTGDGTFYFGLMGTDGKNNYFKVDALALQNIAMELNGLIEAFLKPPLPKTVIDIPGSTVFQTARTQIVRPQGNETNGHVEFHFLTPENTRYQTTIGPVLAAQMATSIVTALSTMANPPSFDFSRGLAKLPGKPHKAGELVTHFGQEYRADILQILGVLIIRASVLESAQVKLLAALADISLQRAEAIFYSSQNNKARLDLMRALVPTSGINISRQKEVLKSLADAGGVSQRRNALVHGEWEFKKDKFIVREKKPLASNGQDPIQTYASIEKLVSDYHDVSTALEIQVQNIFRLRASPNTPVEQ